MLQHDRSKPKMALRYALILPMLGLFTILFASDLGSELADDKKQTNFTERNNDRNSTKENETNKEDEIVRFADEMPMFPGCEDQNGSLQDKYTCANRKFVEYVIANSAMEKEAVMRNALNGAVKMSFIVTRDGTIKDVKVESDFAKLGKTITESIQKLEKEGVYFKPGKFKGKEVDVLMKIPFIIRNGAPANTFVKEKKEFPADQNGTYFMVDERPRFPGCEQIGGWTGIKEECSMEKMFLFLDAITKAPQVKEGERWRTYVSVQVIVTKSGEVKIVNSERYQDDAFEVAAKKAVLAMNDMPLKWIPGKKDGKPVDVHFWIPFSFTPQKNTDNGGQKRKKWTLVVVDEKYITSTDDEEGPLTKIDPNSIKAIKISGDINEIAKYSRNPEELVGIVSVETYEPEKTIRTLNSMNPLSKDDFGTEYFIEGRSVNKSYFDAYPMDEIEELRVLNYIKNGISIKKLIIESKSSSPSINLLTIVSTVNPAPKDKLQVTVKSLDSVSPAFLKVYDVNGKMIHSQNLKLSEGQVNVELNLSGKISGNYSTLLVVIEQGKELQVAKVVVE